MQIDVAYPDRAAERRILIETTGDTSVEAKSAMSAETHGSTEARAPASSRESVVEAILDLVRRARRATETLRSPSISLGVLAPRGAALMLATRARALLGGRLSPSLDDIVALAVPVLKHRMALTFAARAEGLSVSDLVAQLAAQSG